MKTSHSLLHNQRQRAMIVPARMKANENFCAGSLERLSFSVSQCKSPGENKWCYSPGFLPGYCCDQKFRAAYVQRFALWQQATIEFTCHDHSPRTRVVTFNGSQVNIGRASMPQSLFYCLFAPRICMVLFFTHILFVVNHIINATPLERLHQYFAVGHKN